MLLTKFRTDFTSSVSNFCRWDADVSFAKRPYWWREPWDCCIRRLLNWQLQTFFPTSVQDNRTLSVREKRQCARESLILQMMKAILCLLQDSNVQIVHTNLSFTIVKFHSNTRRFLWRFYWWVQQFLSTYNVRICESCKKGRKAQAPFT